MSKTNHETMQPEAQAGEGLKLDVTVRPIAPVRYISIMRPYTMTKITMDNTHMHRLIMLVSSHRPISFSMIQNLSETVVIPIAGIILTFVLVYELIQMILDRLLRAARPYSCKG